MIEKEMGYRGSKSIVFLDFCVAENIIVKEQRVDGSWCIKFMHSRCTLMGFERNYQIKILSKQINKVIYYTSLAINQGQTSLKMNPWFLDASTKYIVVWGTNLQSTVGIKFTLKQLATVQLAPYQYSVIIGLLLSDGWLIFASKANKNARLGFTQSGAHGEYFWFVFCSLSHYCSSYPRVRIRSHLEYISLEFFTRSMPCITELHSLFYPNGVKIVPYNIYELLTPVALAHLIMGDGQVVSNGLRICTDAYSSSDIVKLINVLMIKYRLVCTIHVLSGRQRIYIFAKSMNLLASIIKPNMVKSMYYKIKS